MQIHGLLTSFVIAGFLLVSMATYTLNFSNHSASQSLASSTKNRLDFISELLEFEMKKIGYTKNGIIQDSPIVYADSNQIVFEADINNDGINDQIKWHYDRSSPVTSTENPKDFNLYRTQRTLPDSTVIEEATMPASVTRLKFTFYDEDQNELASPVFDPDDIESIQVYLMLESLGAVDGKYEVTLWEKTIYPINLSL